MNIEKRFLGGVSLGGILNKGAMNVLGSVVSGVTAHAGGGQSSATVLTGLVNSIDTVATAADSVALPAPSYPGQIVIAVNNTSNSAQVFGSGTDTINNVATATGVALAAGKIAIHIAMSTGAGSNWFRLLSA